METKHPVYPLPFLMTMGHNAVCKYLLKIWRMDGYDYGETARVANHIHARFGYPPTVGTISMLEYVLEGKVDVLIARQL